MAKLTDKKFKELAFDYLKKRKWKVNEDIEYFLVDNDLDYYSYKPHAMIEKDGFKFFLYIFNKEYHFWSKATECLVTGFDYYKFKIMQEFERKTKIPASILFHSESDDKFIFKQLKELGNPIIWQLSQCYNKQYCRKDLILKCIDCRWNQKYTFMKCVKRKTKLRPMGVWQVDKFNDTVAFQIGMFN